jgi:hypothetical protein
MFRAGQQKRECRRGGPLIWTKLSLFEEPKQAIANRAYKLGFSVP